MIKKPTTRKLKAQIPIFTTEAATIGAIVTFLEMSGFHVWRNNTYGVYDQTKGHYRKLQYQQRGVSDIIGFRKSDAKFIAVEVKIGTDTIKVDQHAFLTQLKKSDRIIFIAHSFDDFLAKYETRFKK